MSQVIENSEFLTSLIASKSFDINKPVQKPEAVISIAGNIISTAQNLTVFKGQSKSGKTANTAAIIAGMIAVTGDDFDSLDYEVMKNLDGKLILHVDTEQSNWNWYNLNKNILLRANLSEPPKWYKSFYLREYDIKDRFNALTGLLEYYSIIFNGVHAIFIDGIADYVKSPNDEEESNKVVHYFEKLAIRFDCPVITVIHLNPSQQNGASKGRGHLDSQLERKAESILLITKDKQTEISTVEGHLFRNAGMVPQMQFMYDHGKGYHVSCGFRTMESKASKEYQKYSDIAKNLFDEPNENLTAGELINRIGESTGVKARAARNTIDRLIEHKLINKGVGHNGKYYLCT